MITKVAFVAQPTTNMDEMKEFYGKHLGLDMSLDFGDMWCEFVTPEGKTLAMDPHSAKQPNATPYVALETDDIEAEVQKLKDAGVIVAKEIWTNEHEGNEICKMAIIVDPGGNPVMLHQIAASRRED
jgi:predicted enzyme related to lactoylglutathione lyase